MRILEFFGGPGSGKTTSASSLWAHFKRMGVSGCEFAREYAQQLIFSGRQHELSDGNQIEILAGQYRVYRDLARAGAKVVFSDSSMRLSCVYGAELPIAPHLAGIVKHLESEFEITRIFVKRPSDKQYHGFGRIGTQAEALLLDRKIWDACGPFDFTLESRSTLEIWCRLLLPTGLSRGCVCLNLFVAPRKITKYGTGIGGNC